MNTIETEVVRLLDHGYARWKIAEELGLGESTVRRVIRRLCDHYGCTQRELPKVVRKENNDG